MTLSSFREGESVVNDTGSTRVAASWTCLFNMHFASKVTKFWRQVFLLRVTWWWRGATCTVQRVRQQVHCCVEETCSWTPGRATFPIYASQWRSLLHHLRRMHSSDFFTIYSRMKEKFRFSIELILIRFRGILGGDCNADLRKLGCGWALRVA